MKNFSKGKFLAAILSMSFVVNHSASVNVFATDITGVSGNNGVYDIIPEIVKGETGIRQYENFNLTKGDIANLIFKLGPENIEKFVNLVDNQININGILNTMRDNQFYNGHAVFVSPNGMVVGASGVLNIGSLSVLTPSQASYNNFIQGGYNGDLANLEKGTSDIKVNGKIIAQENINLIGRDIAINSKGALIAGSNNGGTLLTTNNGADVLFNSLVNTNGITSGNNIVNENGNITIKTDIRDGGIKIAGLLKNNGKGDISITNGGTENLNISGEIKNTDGNVTLYNRQSSTNISGNITNSNGLLSIDNSKGLLNIKSTANIKNNGDLKILSRQGNGINIDGNVSNNGSLLISNNGKMIKIDGKITNQNGDLKIYSNGSGLDIKENALITNNDSIGIANTGKNGFKMNGTIQNSGSTALTNWTGDFLIDGIIDNANGKMNLSNADSQMTITENAIITNNGDLQIINSGTKGLSIDGTITNNSTTNINSVKGNLNINGQITNTKGKLTIQNSGKTLNTGKDSIISNDSTTLITNTGEGMNLNGLYKGSGYTTIDNQNGDLNINGSIEQYGNRIVVKNSGNSLNINSEIKGKPTDYVGTITIDNGDITIFNTGEGGTNINGIISKKGNDSNKISIVNQNGGLNIYDADIINTNGDLNISNSGTDALKINKNSTIKNETGLLSIVNGSESGADINGLIENSGKTNITNLKGHIVSNATIKNKDGRLEIVSNGSGMTLGGDSYITNNNEIRIANTGADGLQIKGNIENNGSTAISNWNGDFIISGKVENQDGKMNITSAQKSNGLNVTKEGQILNNNNELFIQNTGKDGIQLNGEVKNNSSTTIYNTAGNLNINGLVQHNGELMVSNKGTNLTIGENAIIMNNGKTTIRNSGTRGLNVDGLLINQDGTLNIENNAGGLNIDKDAWIINRNDTTKITNDSGYSAIIDGNIYSLEGDDIIINNIHQNGGITLESNAQLKTEGNVNLTNTGGSKGIKIRGNIQGNDVNLTNSDSHIVLGNNSTENLSQKANIEAKGNVNINQENGSVLNAGTTGTLIKAEKDLNIKVNNGKIGVETGTSGGGYTYGPDGTQVDTSKSINIDVKGKINSTTSDTKGTGGDYVTNFTSKGSNMNIDHIKADGRVILLTDFDENGQSGSILNAANDATKPNMRVRIC